MQNKTLFFIQSTYSNVSKIWGEFTQMAQSDDHVVIMGDAVLQVPNTIVATFPHLYCLSNEQSLLGDEVKNHVKIIEYNELADLVLKFERCISLK